MSTDFNVYASAERIPGLSRAADILPSGSRVQFIDPPNFVDDRGYLPVLLDGRESGFEVYRSKVTDEDRQRAVRDMQRDGLTVESDPYWRAILTCDTDIMFVAHDDTEAIAAELVARALAEASHGYFSDPQTGEVTPPPGP